MDAKELAAELGKLDRETAIAALREAAPGLNQAIYQDAFNLGYGKRSGETTEVAARLKEADAKLATVTSQLEEAKKASPDLEKIHGQYRDQIEELQRAHAEALSKATRTIVQGARARVEMQLVDALVARGVKRRAAEHEVQRRETSDRLQVADDGTVTILAKGGNIPLATTGAMTPTDAFIDELFPRFEADDLSSRAGPGAGNPGNPGNNNAGEYAYLDAIRADVKKAAERQVRVAPHGAFAGLGDSSTNP